MPRDNPMEKGLLSALEKALLSSSLGSGKKVLARRVYLTSVYFGGINLSVNTRSLW